MARTHAAVTTATDRRATATATACAVAGVAAGVVLAFVVGLAGTFTACTGDARRPPEPALLTVGPAQAAFSTLRPSWMRTWGASSLSASSRRTA